MDTKQTAWGFEKWCVLSPSDITAQLISCAHSSVTSEDNRSSVNAMECFYSGHCWSNPVPLPLLWFVPLSCSSLGHCLIHISIVCRANHKLCLEIYRLSRLAIMVINRLWFLHFILGMGEFLRRSCFFIILKPGHKLFMSPFDIKETNHKACLKWGINLI